jgi:hypothetical protein
MNEELLELLVKSSKILPARERGNCRIIITWKGDREFISAGTKKPAEARAVRREKIREWYLRLPKVEDSPKVVKEGMREDVERYMNIDHEHSKPGTKDEARRNLKKLGDLLGWPQTSTLTKDLYREKYPFLRDAVASHTWANELGEHRRFARYLVREEIIRKDFTEGIKRPKRATFGTRQEIYREEWFQPIWEALELHWRLLWDDLWFTGMDIGDLWEFELSAHLVPVSSTWKIWKQRAKETEIIDQPLSSRIKDRWVGALESGQRYLHPSGRRYANAKSWGNQFRAALHAAQRKLGLPLLDAKTTRHTFATRHLLRLIRGEKNAPTVEEIQRWLGHAKGSTEIHRVYLKLLSNPHLMD